MTATGDTSDVGPCPACRNRLTRLVRTSAFGPSALVGCQSCRTQFLAPQPSEERLAEIYGADYYAAWTAEDDAVVDSMKRLTFAPILDACRLEPGSSVLDLGCANGSFLADADRRGLRTFGIDLNPEAIVEARRRVPDATLHSGYASEQPFGDARFDAIVMIDFIEHVRDPETELSVIREWLRPGARLVISTPRVDSELRLVMRRYWPQYREEHLTYFSRAGIVKLLDRCGLSVAAIRPTKKALTLAYAYGQMRAYPVPVAKQTVTLAYRLLPALRHRPVRVGLGEMTVVAVR